MCFNKIVDLLYVYFNDRLGIGFKCYKEERRKSRV